MDRRLDKIIPVFSKMESSFIFCLSKRLSKFNSCAVKDFSNRAKVTLFSASLKLCLSSDFNSLQTGSCTSGGLQNSQVQRSEYSTNLSKHNLFLLTLSINPAENALKYIILFLMLSRHASESSSKK